MRRPARWAAAYFGAVCLMALARDFHHFGGPGGHTAKPGFIVAHALLEPVLWAGLLLLTFRVSQRTWGSGAPGVLLVAGVALVFQAAQQGALAVLRRMGGQHPSGAREIVMNVLLTYPSVVVIALCLLAAGSAMARLDRLRAAEARAARLAADVAALRASALENHLRPHFFFNTLQSIATLLHRDAAGARAMTARLRRLLESSLAADARPAIPLAEELALLALYTDIEMVRFGDRLKVRLEVEPPAGRALVPRFLLQPLVENAVMHAVAVRGEGAVTVAARADAGRLQIRVTDTGPGADQPAATRARTGIGLANTRARLESLYGRAFALEIAGGPRSGTSVRLEIPLEMEPAQAPSSSSAQRA